MNIAREDFNRLENVLSELSKQKFFYFYNSIWRILFVSLLKGLASGLGFVIGATLLVSLLTFALSQIEFIPIIGDFVSKVIVQIRSFDR